jgi:hypothetical protein
MQVICIDGTWFSCSSYQIVDDGVKLYSRDVDDGDDPQNRYEPDKDEFQVGYVPDRALLYVVPDGVEPVGLTDPAQAVANMSGAGPPGSAGQGAEPGGAAPRQPARHNRGGRGRQPPPGQAPGTGQGRGGGQATR